MTAAGSTTQGDAPAGRLYGPTFAYYFAFVALGLVVASLGPTLTGLAENTHAALRDISLLFSARALGYLCGSALGGRLYDRIPGHPLMAAVLAVIVVLLLLVPFAVWLPLLVLLMLVLGMNEGALDVGCNTLIVWVHGHRVGPYMQALHFFFGVGAFLSPIVVAQALVWSGGVDWPYRALALLLVPAALWLWRTPSPAAQRVSDEGAGQVNRALVALVMLFLFIYAGVEGGFGGWVFAYVTGLGLSDGPTAAYLTSTFWGALTLGRLLAIPLAARFSPGVLLFGDLLAALLSIGVVLAGPGSLALTWLGTVAFGLAIASIFPTTLALAERRMTITGQVTGWFFVGSSLGAMFWPWLIGQLFDASGPSPTMLIVAFDLAAALLLFFLMNAHARRSALKPVETAEA